MFKRNSYDFAFIYEVVMIYLEEDELEVGTVYLCQTYTGNLTFVIYYKSHYEDLEKMAQLPLDGYVRYVWDLKNIPDEIVSELNDDQITIRQFMLSVHESLNRHEFFTQEEEEYL